MKLNIIIHGSGYSSQSGYSAFRFAQAALNAGHEVSQVFFYQDGVSQANDLNVPLSDEFNPVEEWASLADSHGLRLLVCVSAAERRGIIGAEQQSELGKSTHNLNSQFEIAGLGMMLDASLSSDRTVTFR